MICAEEYERWREQKWIWKKGKLNWKVSLEKKEETCCSLYTVTFTFVCLCVFKLYFTWEWGWWWRVEKKGKRPKKIRRRRGDILWVFFTFLWGSTGVINHLKNGFFQFLRHLVELSRFFSRVQDIHTAVVVAAAKGEKFRRKKSVSKFGRGKEEERTRGSWERKKEILSFKK